MTNLDYEKGNLTFDNLIIKHNFIAIHLII